MVLGDDAAGDEAVDWFARALEAVTGRDRRERAATACDALRNADIALYAAKDAGKNAAVLYEPALRDDADDAEGAVKAAVMALPAAVAE